MVTLLLSLWLSLASQLMASDTAKVIFAGDAMQHQSQIDAARQPDGNFDYSECFASISPLIKEADFAVVNLETPLGGPPYSGYPLFCAPDSYLDALVNAGFDFFLTANNHTLDRRDNGLRRTIEQFTKRNLPHIGTYRELSQRDSLIPAIINVNGFRLGLLNYTYGTNGIPTQGNVVVDTINFNLIKNDVERTIKAGAELISVCLHWGYEYHLKESVQQKRLAQKLADIGVDMVIGSHPHVVQPIEVIDNHQKDDKRCIVVYSLGNFISGMKTDATRGGALAELTFRRNERGYAYVDPEPKRHLLFTVTPRNRGENFRLVNADSAIANNSEAEQQRRAFINLMR